MLGTMAASLRLRRNLRRAGKGAVIELAGSNRRAQSGRL